MSPDNPDIQTQSPMQPAADVLRHTDVTSETRMKGGKMLIFSWSKALGCTFFLIALNNFFNFIASLHLDEAPNVEYINIGSDLRLANNGWR